MTRSSDPAHGRHTGTAEVRDGRAAFRERARADARQATGGRGGADLFSEEEIDQILAWLEENSPRKLLLPALVALGGLRPSEAAGIRRADWNASTAELNVERAIARRELGPIKTRSSRRRIILSPRLAEIIARSIPADCDPGDLLVSNATGQVVDTLSWGTLDFHRICAGAGVPYRPFSSLRSASIVRQLRAGAPITEIAAYHGVGVALVEALHVRRRRAREVADAS